MAELPAMTASLEAALSRMQPATASPWHRLRGLVVLGGTRGQARHRLAGTDPVGLPFRRPTLPDTLV
jgi:hypothetical protein